MSDQRQTPDIQANQHSSTGKCNCSRTVRAYEASKLKQVLLCRQQVQELQHALEAAQAEHMDYAFLRLQLHDHEAASEHQQQQVLLA